MNQEEMCFVKPSKCGQTSEKPFFLFHHEWLFKFSSVQSLSRVQLFATPWIAAHQASLSITNSRSSLRLKSIESVMPSSHLILCRPLLLLPPIPSSSRVFSNESILHMRWPKYWSFSFSIIPSKEMPGLISFRMEWLLLNFFFLLPFFFFFFFGGKNRDTLGVHLCVTMAYVYVVMWCDHWDYALSIKSKISLLSLDFKDFLCFFSKSYTVLSVTLKSFVSFWVNFVHCVRFGQRLLFLSPPPLALAPFVGKSNLALLTCSCIITSSEVSWAYLFGSVSGIAILSQWYSMVLITITT